VLGLLVDRREGRARRAVQEPEPGHAGAGADSLRGGECESARGNHRRLDVQTTRPTIWTSSAMR
jgi:hypothetical protein